MSRIKKGGFVKIFLFVFVFLFPTFCHADRTMKIELVYAKQDKTLGTFLYQTAEYGFITDIEYKLITTDSVSNKTCSTIENVKLDIPLNRFTGTAQILTIINNDIDERDLKTKIGARLDSETKRVNNPVLDLELILPGLKNAIVGGEK